MPNLNQTANRTSLDWRNTTRLRNVIPDDGSCHADWAFTTVQTLEAALAISRNKTGDEFALSVQHLIDCDQSNSGCLGGWPARAYKYIYNKGYLREKDYAYIKFLGRKSPCIKTNDAYFNRIALRSRQYLKLEPQQLMDFVATQPVAVAINAPECVYQYKSGILSNYDCKCSAIDYDDVSVNVIMTLVGYQILTPNDKESGYCDGAWILRSSWGSSFGENGHIRLCITKNKPEDEIGTCNILVYPQVPDVGLIQ